MGTTYIGVKFSKASSALLRPNGAWQQSHKRLNRREIMAASKSQHDAYNKK